SHHVVVREDAIGAKETQCDDAAATARRHHRLGPTSEGDQRVGADIKRGAKAFTRGLGERADQFLTRCERRTMHDEVESAMLLFDSRVDGRYLVVFLHIERQHERTWSERIGKLADMLLEAPL